jgi:superfamily II DNA/RNA helicase
MPFSDLGLSPALLASIAALGHLESTPIQRMAIPAIGLGRDILATAPTGSGKTLAFSAGVLQRLGHKQADTHRLPQVLILVPTRELAIQVGETINSLAKRLPSATKVSVVFGGISINPQMMAMRGGTDVVVATTGRLLDLVDHNALVLSGVHTLVLDEADRMIDLGFSEELNRVLALIPQNRQSLFFSATFPGALVALAGKMLQNPQRIDIPAPTVLLSEITQRAIQVDSGRRTQLLRHLINEHKWKRVLVFVATKHAAEIVADKLRKVRIYAEPFHGELTQGKRMQVLQDFKASRLKVVVATDVAARGIDIAQLPVVVNYDLPRSATDYTHRIGRTGRAGEQGLAVSFVCPALVPHFQLIQKRHGLSLALEVVAEFEPEEAASPASAPNGGIKGKRPSKKDKLRAEAARLQDKPPNS